MRISTNIVLFMVLSSAFIGAFEAGGVWEDWGVDVDAGISDQIDETQDAFKRITTGSLGADTLIGVFLTVLNTLKLGYALVTALPTFMGNVGVPTIVTDILDAVVFIIIGRDILSAYAGRRT